MAAESAQLPPVPTGPTRDHASYVGGSDIAAVVGVSPYATALDVWAEKTRRNSFAGNEATELGNHFERPALELYARRRKIELLEYPGTLSHPQLPHVAATPDAIANRRRGVQCKIVGYGQARRWGDPSDGPEGAPEEVVLQVQYEAALARRALDLRAEVSDIVAVVGTDMRIYEVPIDVEMGDSLVDIADHFWRTHVEPDLMPEVVGDDAETLRKIFPRVLDPRVQLATDEVMALARRYDACRTADAEKKRIGAQLAALVGTGLGFVSPSEGIKVTWAEKAGGVSWKDTAARYRDIAMQLGAQGAELDRIVDLCRSEPTRALDVRVKET